MDFIKTAIRSKSNWLIVVAAIAGALGKYGYEISPILQGQLVELILNVVTVGASVGAVTRHTKLKIDSE